MTLLNEIVKLALKKKASDIHLVAGYTPYIRVDGELLPVKMPVLTNSKLKKVVDKILSPKKRERLRKKGDLDTGFEVEETLLRLNIHKQTNGYGVAIRIFAKEPPLPKDILLEQRILDVTNGMTGLVIISGPAGSGKSTTLATLIRQINEKSRQHVITLEDPIEYRFKPGQSLIEQRELGRDFRTFASGLRHVLRQDPNVIVIGEMRDPETIELALTAAETGHLVLSTLHSPNATEAVERIVGVFEGARQDQILTQLSAALTMVVAQRLIARKGGGRIAGREILVNTTAVSNAIRMNKLSVIQSAIETGRKYGMISMKQVLNDYRKKGIIE